MALEFSPRISPGLNFSSKTYYKVFHKSYNLWLLTTFNFYIGFCDFLHIWLLERQKINSLMKFSKLFWSKHLDSRSQVVLISHKKNTTDLCPSLCIWGRSRGSQGMAECYPAPPWLSLSGIFPDTVINVCVVLLRVNGDQRINTKQLIPNWYSQLVPRDNTCK